jgi:hypothetical protein
MAPITRSAARKDYQFSSLPTELRLMIWRKSFESRILHITSETILSHLHKLTITHVRFKSREKPPIALQVCHESRALALKNHIASFHSYTFPHASGIKQTALYFNPELDTVHIAERLDKEFHDPFRCTDSETTRSIRTFFDDHRRQDIAGGLCAFQSLETLILVVGDETGQMLLFGKTWRTL